MPSASVHRDDHSRAWRVRLDLRRHDDGESAKIAWPEPVRNIRIYQDIGVLLQRLRHR